MFILPFSSTLVFPVPLVLQAKIIRRVLSYFVVLSVVFFSSSCVSSFQAGWRGQGQAAGGDETWWDGTIGGRRGMRCGGTIDGAGLDGTSSRQEEVGNKGRGRTGQATCGAGRRDK